MDKSVDNSLSRSHVGGGGCPERKLLRCVAHVGDSVARQVSQGPAKVVRSRQAVPVVGATEAVGAGRRLPCDARSGLAPRNSLRSLRSLRSNKRGESDLTKRAARADPSPALLGASHAPTPSTACRECSEEFRCRVLRVHCCQAPVGRDGNRPIRDVCSSELVAPKRSVGSGPTPLWSIQRRARTGRRHAGQLGAALG